MRAAYVAVDVAEIFPKGLRALGISVILSLNFQIDGWRLKTNIPVLKKRQSPSETGRRDVWPTKRLTTRRDGMEKKIKQK